MQFVNSKKKAHGSFFSETTLLLIRMQGRQLDAVDLGRHERHATNMANLYVERAGNWINLYRTYPGPGPDGKLFSFNIETGAVGFEPLKLREVYPNTSDDQITMRLLELLARVEQCWLGNDQWMHRTQITPSTRKKLSQFLGLLIALTDTSNDPVAVRGKNGVVRAYRKEEDGVAIYEENGTLALRLFEDSFELGPNFATCTDFDTTLDGVIVNLRPGILEFRKNIQRNLAPLNDLITAMDNQCQKALTAAYSAAYSVNPDVSKPELAEFSLDVERYNVIRNNEGWTIRFQTGIGIKDQGIAYWDRRTGKLRVMPNALSYLKAVNYDIKGLVANSDRIVQAFANGIVTKYTELLEAKECDQLGLTRETYHQYLEAYQTAVGTGYKKSFYNFVEVLKAVL